ncbi:MAG: excinuclease ABC subunit UvrA [Defluviitaleaceae bacterium]|nr:excinuclease ABC subunit UvrA [Defluviitaleaceae bacterium]
MPTTVQNKIIIKGAKENNLQNVDLEMPRDSLIVFTGVSGSGKTSLAFDTIFAEGQRRYMESLSSYARQFLGQMEKPDVESISGLSPAISIDQKTTNQNPRSTVGTVTEIYDYLRLLFARIGIPHCPNCGKEIRKQTIDEIVDAVLELKEGTKLQILAPIVRGRRGAHQKLLQDAKKNGYIRVRIDGETYDLNDEIQIVVNKKHDIEIVVDRLIVREGIGKRLSESIETVFKISTGILIVEASEDGETKNLIFSQSFSCPDCGINLDTIEPKLFSFNSPVGACTECTGLGMQRKFDVDLVIPNKRLSLLQGAVVAPGWNSIPSEGSMSNSLIKTLAKNMGFNPATPFEKLEEEAQKTILYGYDKSLQIEYYKEGEKRSYYYEFEGILENLARRYAETTSETMRAEYEDCMAISKCPACKGGRLKPEVLAITVNNMSISEVTSLTVKNIRAYLDNLKLEKNHKKISEPIIREIKARATFLVDVGLDYLTLSRQAGTLSGGESQRIRLATQIGSGLVGVVYILDEPSIGLHQRDNDRLLETLNHLKNLGNTLIVVEHDTDTMLAADYIVDVGPNAGVNGGKIVYSGTVPGILECEGSITGEYLSGKRIVEVPNKRRKPSSKFLEIIGASENNLNDVTIKIPLGILTCVTGVSGSGKSSLVNQILYKTLARDLNRAKLKPGKHKEILGTENLDKIINIDQSPIGRTPRSNPATYTGIFDIIRDVFSNTQEAKIRGYAKGRFSFNVKGGRCEACSGDGILKIEMHFLPDVYVPCEVCNGKRYNRETLEVKYKEKDISEVLNMTIDEALKFFENLPRLKEKLQTVSDVGIGYVRLGQSSTTLSGGEAQRIKLATELSKRATGKTIYVLDEPTTGLSTYDVHKLTHILSRLTDTGNTVVVIEHNLDVIKTADYIIDMGPEGGDGGGNVVACGTPEEVAKAKGSYTGKYLKKVL